MSNIIAEFYDIHDNDVTSYEVDIENKKLILHTTNDEKASINVVFMGVLTHKFENVMLNQNILFNITNVTIDYFILQYENEISEWLRFIVNAKNTEECKSNLEKAEYKAFEISSSIGLSGFVVAKEISFVTEQQ